MPEGTALGAGTVDTAAEDAESSFRATSLHVREAARVALYAHAPLVLIVVLYVAVGTLILSSFDRTPSFSYGGTYSWAVTLTFLYLFAALIWAIGRDVFLARRRPADGETWRIVFDNWLGTRRLVGTVIVLLTLPALLRVMYEFRLALTLIQPFHLDPELMRLDAWLHGGRHPFEWLQPLLGTPVLTNWIDYAYVAGYFVTLWVGVIWQTVSGREPVRTQFLLTFALSWILLGTIGAIALSSAGPAFYGRVTGLADPYQPLMAYLQSVDVTHGLHALDNQARLWTSHTEWGGMTAMPSMHVAIVFAVVLAAIRTHRRLGLVMIPLLVVIVAGSVHLGWHYALDAYVSLAGVASIWWGAGRFTRWWREARVNSVQAAET